MKIWGTAEGVGGSSYIAAYFDSEEEGFTYSDDTFRGTTEPNHGGGLDDATGGDAHDRE